MSTTVELKNHLEELHVGTLTALQTVNDFKKFGDKLTSGNKATELAKITTVPTTRQHASDCAICTSWDGS